MNAPASKGYRELSAQPESPWLLAAQQFLGKGAANQKLSATAALRVSLACTEGHSSKTVAS